MKDIIKNSFLIVGAIVIIILLITRFDSCTRNNTNELVTTTELNSKLQAQKDSLETLRLNERIGNFKAGQDKEKKNTVSIQVELDKTKRNYSQVKHRADSLQRLVPESDTTCIKALTAKQAQIDTLDHENVLLDQEAESYSKRLYLCEQQSMVKDTIITNKTSAITETTRINETLINQLRKKDNWFERNKIWIGVVAGATGVFVLTRL